MSFDKETMKQRLRASGLRTTAPRLAVLAVLSEARSPLSNTEVLERLGATDWDPATIYRNLIKLRDAGLAVVASRVEGIDRYALATADDDGHKHPHFVCEDCGRVACLPAAVADAIRAEGRWAASVRAAAVQLRGECPDCLSSKT